MAAVTEQKRVVLRLLILSSIQAHISENPQEARDVALGACSRLARRMTLKELEEWHARLAPNVRKEGL